MSRFSKENRRLALIEEFEEAITDITTNGSEWSIVELADVLVDIAIDKFSYPEEEDEYDFDQYDPYTDDEEDEGDNE